MTEQAPAKPGLTSNNKPLEEYAGPMPDDWESEERSYLFETRLGRALQLKDLGNVHFRSEEWSLAFRRYKKALYHAHFDELQCWDLMDQHKEMLRAVQTPVKLNFVVCILKMLAAGDELDAFPVEKADGEAQNWIDRAEEVCNEVIKFDKKNVKAHYRKSQVLEHRTDIAGAELCLDEVEKLEGNSASVRAARKRLRDYRKAARAREREMYGGLIQESSVFEAQDAAAERREARREVILRVTSILAAPVTWPARLVYSIVRPACRAVLRTLEFLLERVSTGAFAMIFGREAAAEMAEQEAQAETEEHLHED